MTTELTCFDFRDYQLRAVTGEDGEPWFIATDVAKILGYRDAGNLARMIDEDEKGTHNLSTPGGTQAVTTVSEAGLYTAILKSRVPNAQPFRRWVTHEVLPSIRKTGRYGGMTFEEATAFLTSPDTVEALARNWKKDRDRMLELEAKVTEDAPKVLFAEAVESSPDSVLIGTLAKTMCDMGIDIGQNRLYAWMRQEGFLCTKGEMWNIPTQRAMNMGLFQIKKYAIQQPSGQTKVCSTTKVTGKGQIYFIDRIRKQALKAKTA